MTKICESLLLFLLLIIQIGSSRSDDIAVYWEQNVDEGNLTKTCSTRLYSFVLLAFLSSFGNGETPKLSLGDQCNYLSLSGCSIIGSQIKYCQQQGIKVMLSIGGGSTEYSLSSPGEAQNLSDYLWNNFLGGSSSSSQRPFGDSILDGVDFNIETTTEHLEDLARYIKSHNTDSQKVYLSAATGCPFPDANLGSAIDKGLFDYVWVRFYSNPRCAYSESNPNAFVNAWSQWSTSLKRSKLFLGLTASELAITYVPDDLLISKVLPIVRKSRNYGGLMLWSRYEDRLTGYSNNLKIGLLCTSQSAATKCRNHDSGFEERFGYMSSDSIKVYESENLGRPKCCETTCWNNCSCEAYAPLSQVNNSGCQIWLKGTRFTEDAGSKGQSIYVVKRKGMLCFLISASP